MLHGRVGELATIDRLLADARTGRSGVLVIRGEAGIGKSALLDYASASAGDMRILRAVGIESETELPFAGLHLLLNRVVDHIDALPEGQAQALRRALGLASASGSDRFLVGVAVLTLLADLADGRPLLCLIDDAHWLDQASSDALLFAARRLEAEAIALIFVARDLHAPAFPAPGLSELRLPGLDGAAAAELLIEHASDLPGHVRAQIIEEARGNPLALLELSAAQREAQIPAYAYNIGALPTHSRIQQIFTDWIGALPERTQTLLLVAAADGGSDSDVVLKAAGQLGASIQDLEPADDRRLMHFAEGRLTFRHPLIRAAAYQRAPVSRRLAVHRALAEALDDQANADRRAWHLAAASTGPDEDVAVALEQSAEHARSRGGYAAVAAAYERAAELSSDHCRRGRRLIAAAEAAADGGQIERAAALAAQAAAHFCGALAQVARIFAPVADEQNRPMTSHRTLTEAAISIAKTDPDGANAMLFHAAEAAWEAGDFAAVEKTAERAAVLRLHGAKRVRALGRAAAGFSNLDSGGVAGGMLALRELLEIENARASSLCLREMATAPLWHLLLGDDTTAHDMAIALERDCRAQGALGVLPHALSLLAQSQVHLGRYRDARASGMEGLRIAADTGQSRSVGRLSSVMADLAAIEGAEERCGGLVAEALAQGVTPSCVRASRALSLLDLGLGRHEAALERLTEIAAGPNRLEAVASLPDLVEAAVRLGQPEPAVEPCAWYHDWAIHSRQPWAEVVALRCRALLSDDNEAERHYARAVQLHRQGGGRPFERARTELLYGEWLRRARRSKDARPQLRSALEIFERLGARPWADRARTELRATGESRTAQDRVPDLLGRLTPQELQVVRLAATGLSNRDIGAQLFLSPRTVGYHLYKAYPKLGVASRGELARLQLAAEGPLAATA